MRPSNHLPSTSIPRRSKADVLTFDLKATQNLAKTIAIADDLNLDPNEYEISPSKPLNLEPLNLPNDTKLKLFLFVVRVEKERKYDSELND